MGEELPTLSLLATCLVIGMYTSVETMYLFVVPLYLKVQGFQILEIGTLVAALALVQVLLATPMGIISDRHGRRVVTVSGFSITSASSVILYFTGSPFTAILSLFVIRIGLAQISPATSALVGDFSDKHHIARSFGVASMAVNVGSAVGPFVAGLLIVSVGYRPSFLFAAALSSLAALFSLATSSRKGDSSSHYRPQLASTLEKASHNRQLLLGWLGLFFGSIMLGGFLNIFQIYAKDSGIGEDVIGLLVASRGLFAAVGRIPLGMLIDRFGKMAYTVSFALAGMALTFPLLTATNDLLFLLAVIGLFDTSRGGIAIGANAMAAGAVSTEERGFAMGVVDAIRQGGWAAGASTIAVVTVAYGFGYGFLSAGIIGAFGSLIILLLGRGARSF